MGNSALQHMRAASPTGVRNSSGGMPPPLLAVLRLLLTNEQHSTLHAHGAAAAVLHCPQRRHRSRCCRSAHRGADGWMEAVFQHSPRCLRSAASMVPRQLLSPVWTHQLCKLHSKPREEELKQWGLLVGAAKWAGPYGRQQAVWQRCAHSPSHGGSVKGGGCSGRGRVPIRKQSAQADQQRGTAAKTVNRHKLSRLARPWLHCSEGHVAVNTQRTSCRSAHIHAFATPILLSVPERSTLRPLYTRVSRPVFLGTQTSPASCLFVSAMISPKRTALLRHAASFAASPSSGGSRDTVLRQEGRAENPAPHPRPLLSKGGHCA
jgi:hypothetical protein